MACHQSTIVPMTSGVHHPRSRVQAVLESEPTPKRSTMGHAVPPTAHRCESFAGGRARDREKCCGQ
eukprot:9146589-Alexandrium_andersonii.AAC.1